MTYSHLFYEPTTWLDGNMWNKNQSSPPAKIEDIKSTTILNL